MFRFFTADLRRNIIKIICLTIGLCVGLLLVAKIYFEQTYDSFLPDIDRIYCITESTVHHGEYSEYRIIAGGMAPELQRNIPQIEIATRFTNLTGQTLVKTEDGRSFSADNITFADTCFFDVLSTPVILGDPHEIMAVEDQAMIPRSLAEKIGGDVIGTCISDIQYGDDYKIIISGIYEDFPLNSSISNAIYVSMPTLKKYMWDSTEHLNGGERYSGYVLLAANTCPDDLHPAIMNHLKKILPEGAFTISNFKVWLRPLNRSHASQHGVKMMSWMLGMLAAIMLLCAGFNYLLIVIVQLAQRSKEMAIRKCYGTDRYQLFARVIGESIFFLLISLILALLLCFSLSDLCRELLGYTPGQLLSTGKVWIVEGLVCVILLIITGVIPSVIYSRTSVAHAFSTARHGWKVWKLVLLSIQFFATGLIMCLLLLVVRQYQMTGNLKMGLEYENIGCFYRNDMSPERTATIINELKKLPFVEEVGTSNTDLTDSAGGNIVWTEGQRENAVAIADLGYINPEIIDVLGIKTIQGGNFYENADSTTAEVIVEERFIDVLHKYFGYNETDIIGKTFYITGHDVLEMTIIGVIENIRRGGLENEGADKRAGILFPSRYKMDNVYIRFSEFTPDNLKEAQKVIDSLRGNSETYLFPYKYIIDRKRNNIRSFGKSVMVVGIVITLIALIGLIGYVADEVDRRAKEIAIRKINGTSAGSIVYLLCKDIIKVALPSLIAGGASAMIIGDRWLSQFTDRVSLSPISMIVCLAVILVFINAIAVINSLRVACCNPINHLRSE